MARVSGLSKEEGAAAGDDLVKATFEGSQPSLKTLRIFHAAGMLSTTSYALRLGLSIDANLTTEVVKVLKGTFQVNAPLSLIRSVQIVAGLCILAEVKSDPPTPGHGR